MYCCGNANGAVTVRFPFQSDYRTQTRTPRICEVSGTTTHPCFDLLCVFSLQIRKASSFGILETITALTSQPQMLIIGLTRVHGFWNTCRIRAFHICSGLRHHRTRILARIMVLVNRMCKVEFLLELAGVFCNDLSSCTLPPHAQMKKLLESYKGLLSRTRVAAADRSPIIRFCFCTNRR